MYELKRTGRFDKDFVRFSKADYDTDSLRAVLDLLQTGEPLPEAYDEHLLHENWANF
jgi:mRNA-degrading endonuclease YafQ of YafQ-DinJ toxin-antitoxin module